MSLYEDSPRFVRRIFVAAEKQIQLDVILLGTYISPNCYINRPSILPDMPPVEQRRRQNKCHGLLIRSSHIDITLYFVLTHQS